jgi:hypothetical protein
LQAWTGEGWGHTVPAPPAGRRCGQRPLSNAAPPSTRLLPSGCCLLGSRMPKGGTGCRPANVTACAAGGSMW